MRKFLALALVAVGCAHAPADKDKLPSPASLVAAADRTPEDRALDEGRKPVEFLEFIGLQPGQKAGELMAGGGYTTELLARAVGPMGKVYGENPKLVIERFASRPWSERLARPINQNVSRVDRELDSPFPPEVHDLDVVVSNAIYHDTVNFKTDRAAMNKAVFDALKPGGAYVVCDSSAKDGSGLEATETLHRIDAAFVEKEVTAAGFKVGARGEFLRHAEDTRDWNASPVAAGPKRGTGDRFCIRFIRL